MTRPPRHGDMVQPPAISMPAIRQVSPTQVNDETRTLAWLVHHLITERKLTEAEVRQQINRLGYLMRRHMTPEFITEAIAERQRL